MKQFKFLACIFLIVLTGCTGVNDIHPTYTKSSFAALPGWSDDNHEAVRDPVLKSCAALQKQSAGKSFGPYEWNVRVVNYQTLCAQLAVLPPGQVKPFIEQNFTPYAVAEEDDPNGLFTGYYESSLRGSRTRHDLYQTPLLRRPATMNVQNSKAVPPYLSRADIMRNPAMDKYAIVFVDDPVDAFFVQIQGSGIVQMDDGNPLQLGYDAQNGHGYVAIGTELIKRGELTSDTVSMQTIRAWLESHPDQRDAVMNLNPSYVFFREMTDGPVGSQGVKLTPERSLAVDRRAIPLGSLIWLSADNPEDPAHQIQRLVVAQDTGGAIKGSVRGDLFWGNGARAESNAGIMKSKGLYWILLPKVD